MKPVEVTRTVEESSNAACCRILTGKKTIKAPFYGTLIRTPSELELVCSNINSLDGSFSAVCFPTENVKKITAGRELSEKQRSIMEFDTGVRIESDYEKIKNHSLWFSNPNWKDERSAQDWKDFSEQPKIHMPAITENLNKQNVIAPDFFVPHVPRISSDSPKYLVKSWADIVRTTGNLAESNFDLPIAIPIFANVNCFRDLTLWNELMKNIQENIQVKDGFVKNALFIVQIDGINLLESDVATTKLNFRDSMTELSQFALDNSKGILFLDTNSEGYFSFSNGVNGFIEGLNGVSGTNFARSKDHHGKYYHREEMKTYQYKHVLEIVKNKSTLPCYCSVCKKISPRLASVSLSEWNDYRRMHLLNCRKDEMNELKRDLSFTGMRLGLMNKLQRSGLKNLIESFNL